MDTYAFLFPFPCYCAGEWWLELLRFYSTKELRLLAKAADCKLHLPADFHLSYELLRGMTHEHVPMRLVQGELAYCYLDVVMHVCPLTFT